MVVIFGVFLSISFFSGGKDGRFLLYDSILFDKFFVLVILRVCRLVSELSMFFMVMGLILSLFRFRIFS